MSGSAPKWIFHVDLDAFYVSMELLRRPELRGQPVIVAGGLGPRAVVNTCSYEARGFGVGSAMPLSRARTLCPEATVLASDFSYYGPASKQFHEILRDFSPVVEPAGADEAYLDLTGTHLLWAQPSLAGREMKQRIRDEIGINASVGIGSNKLIAKVASDAGKPDGLVVVPEGGEAAFLAPMPVRELPMVGPKTEQILKSLGIGRIGEIASAPASLLSSAFGNMGRELQARAQGTFSGPVAGSSTTRRSISREQTFGSDVTDYDRLRATLLRQADLVGADLGKKQLAARTVTMKLRFFPFETLTRANSPESPVLTGRDIFEVGAELFDRAWEANHRRPVRLVGLGVTSLQERARQLGFGESTQGEELADTLEGIRDRYGRASIKRAAEIRRNSIEPD